MRMMRHPWMKAIIALLLVGVLSFTTLFAIVRLGAHDEIQGDPQIIIVLGCLVLPTGAPSTLLRNRLDEAYGYWQEHPQMTIVVSGGQGVDEPMAEALCMGEYLIALGVPAEQVLLEDQSHNTNQNIRYSMQLLEENGFDVTADMMIVSSGFHLARARMLWGRITGTTETLSTLAAPSEHLASLIYMNLREPLALVKSFIFDR